MSPVTSPAFSYRDVMERLLAVERRLKLFEQRIAGAPFWEYVRLPLHFELTRRLGLLDFPATAVPRRWKETLRLAASSIRSALFRNPFLGGESNDVLFLGYARRTRLPSGAWSDVHLDPHLASAAAPLYLEPLHGRRHYAPSATLAARHHDVFDLAVMARRFLAPVRFQRAERALLAAIDQELQQTFGVPVSVEPHCRDVLPRRAALVSLYCRLLRKRQPKLVVVVSPNTPERALIEAARGLNIHTAELQHGVIGRWDPSYTFPDEADELRSVADDLLIYGDFWQRLVRLPGRGRRVRSIGYAHGETHHRAAAAQRRRQVLFLSQPTIGQRLADWALQAASRNDCRWSVIFRPHPDERDWQRRYPQLIDSRVAIDDGTRSLSAALAESAALVGVSSFAMYEGLAQGLPTYVALLPGAEHMQDAIAAGLAYEISSASELPAALPPINLRQGAQLFRPQAVLHFAAYVAEIVQPAATARRLAA